MSGDVRPNVKTGKKLLEKFIPQPFFKLIAVVLTRLKNMWLMQNTLSGIQIYGDMED
jgi:hypothetical protein